MTATLVLQLIGIALLDSLNPSLFVAQFYLLTTPRPVPRILSYIAGVMLVNVAGGALILSGMRRLISTTLQQISTTSLFSIQLAIGVAILLFGLWFKATSRGGGEAKKPRSLRPIHTFVLGIVVMLNEITTALPYFIAIERITQAQLSTIGNSIALLIYNVIFSAPLFGFLALLVVLRQRLAATLDRINAAITRWTPRVVKYGSIGLGLLLAVDAAFSLGGLRVAR